MLDEARRAASNGYAAVVGLTRGKGCSPDKPVPYEHDGFDAAALIDWISTQDWSDHRVGMYGGSYSGATAWAAAKHMPKALKAIAVGAPVAPAIDVPMEGNVFENFVYPWPFYATNNKSLDNATYNDRKRWDKLNPRLVCERPRLSCPGQDRWDAQPDLRPLDRSPELRCLLAKHDSLQERLRQDQHPGP